MRFFRHTPAMLLCCLAASIGFPDQSRGAQQLLLHWNFDHRDDNVAHDISGNGLDGQIGARRVPSPGNKALLLDGMGDSLVSVEIPQPLRLGTESWTFMAMLKPEKFQIDREQNQRRIFAFGQYPEAYLVIDIRADGHVTGYFCYQNDDGDTVSASCTSASALIKQSWAHLALVCDRENRQMSIYINGFAGRTDSLPERFEGDFRSDGRLTVGSSWQNYMGLVDEVKIWRAALSSQEIESEFDALKSSFHVTESEETATGRLRLRLTRSLDRISSARVRGDLAEVRRLAREIIANSQAPSHFRSYAHLRVAQSQLAEDNSQAARSTYQMIADEASYPAVHRYEAQQLLQELARRRNGLSARDPSATHTPLPKPETFAAELFVASATDARQTLKGSDQGDGSQEQPFATLQRARDEIRVLRDRGLKGPVAVTLKRGRYRIGQTLQLSEQDSGTEDSPVVYRAERPGAAVLYGGKLVSVFMRVTDQAVLQRLPAEARNKVWQCDLKRYHKLTDYGQLQVRGFAQPPSPPTLELYVNRVPMTLARWPNDGFVGIQRLIQPGSKSTEQPSVFEYQSDRHARWKEATDAWLFGYFHFLWADATIKIAKIDTSTKTITTAEPYHYSGRGMSTEQGIQYYAFNLLEEIDAPGEWFLDRETGMLYLYPPVKGPWKGATEIGILSTPMVSMEGVSHTRFEGIVFDLARYNALEAKNCDHCWLTGCTFSRMAGNGVMIHGGTDNRVVGCDIHTIGRRAMEVTGGDRRTLRPGRHLVENCRIHNFGRIDRTYTPAIQLEGVGHRVAHNLMYDGPSSAMRIEGNDHLIEFNEVHSMVQESDDQGALELFRNPTYRGVVFRHNYLHHIGKTGTEAAVHGQAAIRFDDAISGMLVYGNIFFRCANGNFGAVQMNSGRDNVMDNNLFLDCKQGISGGWYPQNHVWTMLREGKTPPEFYQSQQYQDQYPTLGTMLDAPGINHVWRNVFYRCGRVATNTNNLEMMANGVFEQDPGLVNASLRDFRMRPEARAIQSVGFRPIPQQEIGLYQSPARASWPTKTIPARLPPWRRTSSHRPAN